jgi:hypothetical protein
MTLSISTLCIHCHQLSLSAQRSVIVMLNLVMQSVIMFNVVMLSAIKFSVVWQQVESSLGY